MRTMIVATIVANVMMIHVAAAQPRVERREGFRITAPSAPNHGPVGTQVKIAGDRLDHAEIVIDGKRMRPSGSTEHELTFAIPELTMGRHKIQVEYEHKVIVDAGNFDVTAANGNGGIVPPDLNHGPGRWHHDRPTILGYAPNKGEAGEKIIIRGQNFTPDLQVVWNDQVLPGVVIKDRDGEIGFTIPKGAASATVYLRGGKLRRDLAVGPVEVAKYDRNEWRHHDDERRAAAEAAWRARADKFAKDRAARDAELARQQAELERSREERRRAYLAEIAAKFQAAFLADPETQSELALHARHVAELNRMERIAADLADQKLGVRIEIAERRENERHDNRMAALKAAFKG